MAIKTTEIIFPVPISEGRIVTINNLPCALSLRDAKKIGKVVEALATRSEKQDIYIDEDKDSE